MPRYPYRKINETSLLWKNFLFYTSTCYYHLSKAGKNNAQISDFLKWIVKKSKLEKVMVNLSEIHHNHHPFGVKRLRQFIRRGIPV